MIKVVVRDDALWDFLDKHGDIMAPTGKEKLPGGLWEKLTDSSKVLSVVDNYSGMVSFLIGTPDEAQGR